MPAMIADRLDTTYYVLAAEDEHGSSLVYCSGVARGCINTKYLVPTSTYRAEKMKK